MTQKKIKQTLLQMNYLLGGRKYRRLENNDFMDVVTKDIIQIFDPRHYKLMLRVEVGFTSDLPKKYHTNAYQQMARLKKGKPKPQPRKKKEKEEVKYVIQNGWVIFDRRTRIKIPFNKTAEDIIKKYSNNIYHT